MRLIIMACLMFMLPLQALAGQEKVIVNEVHETGNQNINKIFIEDVLSLLPDNFKKHLIAEDIYSSFNTSQFNAKWHQYNLMPRDDFFHIYNKLAKSYARGKLSDSQLSDELGNTLATIIAASMVSGNSDLLGDRFKQNINSFFKEEKKKQHLIKYEGYNGCDIKTCTEQIYDLAKYDKESIYPLIVTRTASLWTAIHHEKDKDTSKVAKTILRQPVNISLVGMQSAKGASPSEANNSTSKNTANSNSSSNSAAEAQEPGFIILIPIR